MFFLFGTIEYIIIIIIGKYCDIVVRLIKYAFRRPLLTEKPGRCSTDQRLVPLFYAAFVKGYSPEKLCLSPAHS